MSINTEIYRQAEILSATPSGAGGLAWQNNFKNFVSQRIGPCHNSAGNPTANDDADNSAGNGNFYPFSRWLNTTDKTEWVCQTSASHAANWVHVNVVSYGPIADNSITRSKICTNMGTGIGSFAQGKTVGSGVIEAGGAGSFAQGYAKDGGIQANGKGSMAQGYANDGYIQSLGIGSFSQGYANIGNIQALNAGTFAQGYAKGGVGGPAYIVASGKGSMAQGFAKNAYSTIKASGNGSFAQGYTTAEIIASGNGSFAQGYGTILASGKGSFAQGYGTITARQGCFCQGYGTITANAGCEGIFMQGYVYPGASIWATAGSKGCFVHGAVTIDTGGKKIEVLGNGCFAAGICSGGAIQAIADGAFVFGHSLDIVPGAVLSANAPNAVQLGMGSNNIPGSLQMKQGGIWIFGDTPGGTGNGQIWLDSATGAVKILVGGVTKTV